MSSVTTPPGLRPSEAELKRNRFPYKLLLRALPLHAIVVARYEAQMALLRLRHPRPGRAYASSRDLLVNLGCGTNGFDGWVNVDCGDFPGVDIVCDCRRRIPLPTGSARAIFTEHLVEHLDYEEEAPDFFAECHRVLRPSGVVRVVVPDGRKYLLAYADGSWDAMRRFTPLAQPEFGFQTAMEVVNAHFRQGGQHRFSYDAETLGLLLASAGFADGQQSEFGGSRLADLRIDNQERASESLYFEAVRP